MLIWSLSNEWVALFWIQRAGQFILDPSWCLPRLSQQLLTRSASTQSSERGEHRASDMHLSQRRKKNLTQLSLPPSCPASAPASRHRPRWVRVEGKRWRRRRPSPPPPPPPRLAPTLPTWPARARARRTRPFPSWRTSSWTSWTKSNVSVFTSVIFSLKRNAKSSDICCLLWFLKWISSLLVEQNNNLKIAHWILCRSNRNLLRLSDIL